MKDQGGFFSWLPPKQDWEIDIDTWINPYVPRSQLYRFPQPLAHFLGYRKKPEPEVGNVLIALWSWVGTFCGLAIVSGIFRFAKGIESLHPPVLFASFGATAVLEYNTIRSPFAQPRAAMMGHTISAITGVALTKLFMLRGDYNSISYLAGAFICGASNAVMSLLNCTHPPGGASALLAAVDPTVIKLGWWFVPLVMMGSALMVAVGLIVNNIQRQFPVFWWTGKEVGRPKKGDEEHVVVADQEKIQRSASQQQSRELGSESFLAISRDNVVLPEGFSLRADEERALALLQDRLRHWTRHEELKGTSTDEEDSHTEDPSPTPRTWAFETGASENRNQAERCDGSAL